LNSTASDETDICLLPLCDVSELIRTHKLSPLELTEATLRRIERLNPELNCYLSVAGDLALRRASELSSSLLDGTFLGPLHGIPVSLKDNISTVDLPTTAGSAALDEWRPSRPATVVQLLEQRGAVIVGKCHMFELAYGAAHDRFGDVRNPWNLDYACGGSSTGSGAAVAAGLCHGSIGTDSGGSIRIPASFCGVVGVKPTYDLVSRAGVIPVSWNLDHVGPMARTVSDAALLLEAIAGDKAGEFTPSPPAIDVTSRLEEGVVATMIGVPAPQQSERLDAEVRAAVERGLAALEGEGAQLREVTLPDLQLAEAVMWLITSTEAADYHDALLREHAGDLHPVVLDLLTRGERVRAVDYVRAQRVRQTLVEQMRRVFAEVDAVVLPTTAIPAFPLGAETVAIDSHQEHVQPAMNRYTPLFNLTGGPAVSIPCGLTNRGLPIGMQVAGPPHADATVLRVARAYERAGSWDLRAPLLHARAPA
jgi:aspartyl-tRNA(Asn)/glutamyl-tRNA(Gln) amidotransferase subunit A